MSFEGLCGHAIELPAVAVRIGARRRREPHGYALVACTRESGHEGDHRTVLAWGRHRDGHVAVVS